jgi:hypothetical protein
VVDGWWLDGGQRLEIQWRCNGDTVERVEIQWRYFRETGDIQRLVETNRDTAEG